MKKIISFFLFLSLQTLIYSQTKYLPGYFVNNFHDTIRCFIQFEEWKNNPDNFNYKLLQGSEKQTITIKDVSSFEIINKVKFIRATVNVDMSNENLNNLSKKPAPEWENKTVFLLYLVEGKANLYIYETDIIRRLFYNIDSSNIKQLIYKSYFDDDKHIHYNEEFKKQLIQDLNCNQQTFNYVKTIQFSSISLITFFELFNECNKSNTIKHYKNFSASQDFYKIGIGSSISNIHIYREGIEEVTYDIKTANKPRISFLYEYENILPYRNKHFAIFLQTEFNMLNESFSHIYFAKTDFKVRYYAISPNLGLRYYFNIKNNFSVNSSIFVSPTSLLLFKSGIQFDEYQANKFTSRGYYGFSIGIVKDKYSISYSYTSLQRINNDFVPYQLFYKRQNIYFTYNFNN